MKWYEGNIAEAIQKSKQEGAVFGVAIFGEDEPSKVLEDGLNTENVQGVLGSGKFVFIRLVGNSEVHQQFSQIYTNATCPSIYLIGDKGSPLEVIKEPLSPSALRDKLQSAWDQHFRALNIPRASAPQQSGADAQRTTAPPPPPSSTSNQQTLEEANEAVRDAEVAAGQANLSMEDKIERARKLAEARRRQKLIEEREEAKQKERERREMGKGMAELKKWQAEQEMKQALEQRKKDKIEEQELRKRLREQIAADRAARNAKTNVSFLQEGPHPGPDATGSSQASASAAAAPTPPRDYTGQARLQFRLPAGTSIMHSFDQTVTLSDVRSFLIDNDHVPFRSFTLSLAYPKRVFSDSAYSNNLRDLGLVPSAALLILPVTGSSSLPSLGGGGVGRVLSVILGYLMIPFTFLFSLLQRALPAPSGGSGSPDTSNPSERDNQPGSASTSTSAGASRTNQSPASIAAELRNRRNANQRPPNEGNVHRLRTDDDDDSATYNGNSTQQM